ncbi:MAG: hypothetical protein DMF81_00575 [Acidobacteria bacterium]|nr:MAG: hypothetical protein DMF81_00575 [Acidobacteriota bacterium]
MSRLLGALLAAAAAVSFAPSPAPPEKAPEGRPLRLHYTPAQRDAGRYQYVPVSVPAGCTRLEVGYRYDKADGGNAIDLGLFEPGPLDLGRAGFRGWSGGSREHVVVAVDEATPGYWPGPLPAGEWQVVLGLYKVAPPGVDVDLTVGTSSAAAGPTPGLAPRPAEPLQQRGTLSWYSGDLHVHTLHSDGTETAAEVARAARAAGLEFIAITDHNNTTHQLERIEDPELLVIAGEEVTTPGGHANVWGLSGWRSEIDFRVLPGRERIDSLVEAAASRGALFSINHPFLECDGCSWEHAIPPGVAALEVWNGPLGPQTRAIALWDRLLREGRRITGVGSSDWHRPRAPLGRGSVRVRASELSRAAILRAIREGRVVVMGDARTPAPGITVRAGGATAGIGDTLRLSAGQTVEVEVPAVVGGAAGGRAELVWNGEPAGEAPLSTGAPARFRRAATASGYLRVELRAPDGGLVVLTNPVYLEVSGTARKIR